MDTPESHALLFSVHSMATSEARFGFSVNTPPDATERFQSLTAGGRKCQALSTEGGRKDCR